MSKRVMPIGGWGNTQRQVDEVVRSAFQGELMKCVLCGAEQKSDPSASSDWRAVDIGGKRFYACKNEFPMDGIGTTEAYEAAYRKFLTAAIIKMKGN